MSQSEKSENIKYFREIWWKENPGILDNTLVKY